MKDLTVLSLEIFSWRILDDNRRKKMKKMAIAVRWHWLVSLP